MFLYILGNINIIIKEGWIFGKTHTMMGSTNCANSIAMRTPWMSSSTSSSNDPPQYSSSLTWLSPSGWFRSSSPPTSMRSPPASNTMPPFSQHDPLSISNLRGEATAHGDTRHNNWRFSPRSKISTSPRQTCRTGKNRKGNSAQKLPNKCIISHGNARKTNNTAADSVLPANKNAP